MMAMFTDAWVKNGEEAVESYKDKCLAVKEKYQK